MALLPQGVVMSDDGQHMGGMGHMGGGVPGMGGQHDLGLNLVNGGGPGTALSPMTRSAEERQLSQWGYHETKEFIALRAELEKDFVATRGSSKTMWEIVSAQMKERGYRRTPAQCKCKWKVLVNRYKGKEISDEADKMFPPFYEELDAIFKERAKNMDRLLLESDVGMPGAGQEMAALQPMQLKAKPLKRVRSEDEASEEEEGEEGEEGEDMGEGGGGGPSRRKQARGPKLPRRVQEERKMANTVQDVLEQFFLQQLKLEKEWRDSIERREAERRLREREWRDRMETLERERMEREQAWRQRQEERQAQEEQRAARREQLMATLLAKLG